MMDGPLSTVSTVANHQELKRAQRLIDEQLGQLAKAEQCGIDCMAFRDALKQVADRLTAIETHFFTPPPTR